MSVKKGVRKWNVLYTHVKVKRATVPYAHEKVLRSGLKRTKRAREPMVSTLTWYKQPQTEVQTYGTYKGTQTRNQCSKASQRQN